VAPPVSTSTTIVQVAGAVDERTGQLRDSLPQTGAPSKPLVAIGIVLLAIGLTIMVLVRLRDRRAHI
jgi:LPXTG-motif cell wall-anchored protein